MYYELYVDVLFLVNFLMDYILLLLVRKMLKCSATHGRVCIGAAIGALLTCFIVIVPVPYVIKFLFSYLFINTFMLVTGLKIRKIKTLVKAVILLYIGTFLLGGILGYIRQYVRVGSLLLAAAIVGYYIILGMWNFLSRMRKMQDTICRVKLHYNGQVCEINGLLDTGNQLKDTVTGEPVSVLGREEAKKLLGTSIPEGIRYIPYHSIGKEQGMMALVRMERMCVQREEECWLEKPLIAISEEQISKTNEYQMILNPNLF